MSRCSRKSNRTRDPRLPRGKLRGCRAWSLHFSNHDAHCGHSEGSKRHADAVEDLDVPEGKKARLSDAAAAAPAADGGAEEAEDAAVGEAASLDDATPPADAAAPVAPGAEGASTGKGKRATKGADLSFKENPFTFLEPGDPVIQACM